MVRRKFMLDELIKELQELKDYKKRYESVLKDKEKMSDLLFELMTEKYNNTPYEDRKNHFINTTCKCCRRYFCNLEIPEDIELPIRSNIGWIPATKGCINFEWD